MRGAQAGADWVALVVGQPDPRNEAVAVAHDTGDEVNRLAGQREQVAEFLLRDPAEVDPGRGWPVGSETLIAFFVQAGGWLCSRLV